MKNLVKKKGKKNKQTNKQKTSVDYAKRNETISAEMCANVYSSPTPLKPTS